MDYVFETEHPDATVRIYEWRGLVKVIQSLTPVTASTRWLDYGCGNGALLRYGQAHSRERPYVAGYEEGWIQSTAERSGFPVFSRLELEALPPESFDIVTAIEVLEHVDDPISTLRFIRRLLKPRGLFFFTVGNAKPYRKNFLRWGYVYPEIHISYFEPETLREALVRTGFEPAPRGALPGYTDIIRFKTLKTLGIRQCSRWEQWLPWPVIARVLDWRLGITDPPIAWAR